MTSWHKRAKRQVELRLKQEANKAAEATALAEAIRKSILSNNSDTVIAAKMRAAV